MFKVVIELVKDILSFVIRIVTKQYIIIILRNFYSSTQDLPMSDLIQIPVSVTSGYEPPPF